MSEPRTNSGTNANANANKELETETAVSHARNHRNGMLGNCWAVQGAFSVHVEIQTRPAYVRLQRNQTLHAPGPTPKKESPAYTHKLS